MPGAIQVEHLVDEHLRGAEQAGGERRAPADGVDERRAALRARVDERAPPGFVLLVAQQQRIDDGVAELADADLQRAAVAHQAARVQADGVIDRGQRRIRRREQVVVVARMIEQQVEGVRAHVGRAQHERHLAMHLAQHHHRDARGAQLRELRECRSTVTSGLLPRLISVAPPTMRLATTCAITLTPRASSSRATCV